MIIIIYGPWELKGNNFGAPPLSIPIMNAPKLVIQNAPIRSHMPLLVAILRQRGSTVSFFPPQGETRTLNPSGH